MPSIGDITAKLKLDSSGFSSSASSAKSQLSGLGGAASSASANFATMGLAFSAALTAPIVAVAAFGISFNAMKEQATVAFTQLLGSAQKAGSFLRELAQFAAQTPFEFPDLVKAAQKFTAVGIEAKNVIPIMTALGDAVAAFGGSSDTINRVTEQIIQMVGKGKVAMEEMRIIGQSIPGSLQAMAKEMGITVDQLFERMSKGSVTAAEGLQAMLVGLTKQFHGNMEKQSQTFTGLMSTLKDTARFAAGDITESLFLILKDGLVKIVEYLPKVVAAFQGIPNQVKLMVLAMAGVAAAVGPVLLGLAGVVALLGGPLTLAVVGITVAIIALAAAIALNFSRIVAIISGSTGAIKINFVAIAGMAGAVLDAFQFLARGAILAFDVIVTGAVLMAQGVKLAFNTVKDAGTAAIALASGDMVGFAGAVGSMSTSLMTGAQDISQTLKGMVARGITDLTNMTSHANGEFAKSFALAAAVAGKTVSTAKRSMDEIIAALTDAFDKMDNGKTKDKANKQGSDIAKSLVSGFIDGTAGLEAAFAKIESSDLSMIFEKLGKKARAGLGELQEALKIGVAAINEFAGKLTEGKITETQFAVMDGAVRRSLERMTLAYQIAHAEIGRIEIEGLAGRKQVIEMTLDAYSKMSEIVKKRVLDLGATFKVVFPGMDIHVNQFSAEIDKANDNVLDALLQNGVGTKAWGDKVTAEFERVSDAAPHWAGAIVDAAARVKTAIENSAEIIRAKAKVEIGDSMRSVIDVFIKLGEQGKLTGDALVRFVRDQVSTLAPELRQGAQKALEEFQLGMYRLPGVLDDVFNKMGEKAKSFASALIGVFDTLPGKWGQSLSRALDEVNKWVNFLDAAIKLVQRIMGDDQTGLGGIVSGIAGTFKKATAEIHDASQDWAGSLEKMSTGATGAMNTAATGIQSGASRIVGAFSQIAGAALAFVGAKGAGALGGAMSGALGGLAAAGGIAQLIGVTLTPLTFGLSALAGGIIGGLIGFFTGGKSQAQKEAEANAARAASVSMQETSQRIASAALDGMLKGFEVLEKLDEFTHVRTAKFVAFFSNMKRLMDSFVAMARQWSVESFAQAKAASEAIGPVADVISRLPAAFDAINGHFGVAESAITRFFADFDRVMNAFFARADVWIDGTSKRAMKVANRLLPVVELISGFAGSVTSISTIKEPSDDMFSIFDRILEKIVTHVEALSGKFDKSVLKTMANFADKAGAALGLWSSAIEAIKATVDIPKVTDADAENITSGIELFVAKLSASLERLATTDLTRIAAFAQTIIPISAAIKAWAETSAAVRGYTVIAAESWDAIVTDFGKALQLMDVLIGQAMQFEVKSITLETILKSGATHLLDGIAAMTGAVGATAASLQNAFGHIQGGSVSPSSFTSQSLSSAPASSSSVTNINLGGLTVSGGNDDPKIKAFMRAFEDLFGAGTLNSTSSQFS